VETFILGFIKQPCLFPSEKSGKSVSNIRSSNLAWNDVNQFRWNSLQVKGIFIFWDTSMILITSASSLVILALPSSSCCLFWLKSHMDLMLYVYSAVACLVSYRHTNHLFMAFPLSVNSFIQSHVCGHTINVSMCRIPHHKVTTRWWYEVGCIPSNLFISANSNNLYPISTNWSIPCLFQ
jgi:hypothetical protein